VLRRIGFLRRLRADAPWGLQELRAEGGDAEPGVRLLLTPQLVERAMWTRLLLGQKEVGETLLQYLLGCVHPIHSPLTHPTGTRSVDLCQPRPLIV